jgi:hypothetical protein
MTINIPAACARITTHMVEAVQANDLHAFRCEVVIGSELVGLEALLELMEQQLPEALSPEDNRTLAGFFLDNDEDGETVESYAHELMQEAAEALVDAGLTQGSDFQVLNHGGEPVLEFSLPAAMQAQQALSVAAWRTLLPWVKVLAPVG